MSYKKLRNIVFTLHRILGFAIAPIAILLGLTGSLRQQQCLSGSMF